MKKNNIVFAQRTGWTSSLNPLISTLNSLQEDKSEVLDLTESNPTRCGFNYPQILLTALNNKSSLLYEPDPRGIQVARDAIVKDYANCGVSVDPNNVFLTSSTSEGYSYLFRLLADAGDNILFPQPSYPLFQFLADINDVDCHYYNLKFDGAWRIDWDSLIKHVDRRTKAIVLVNPNNPTGSYIHPDDLVRLNGICSELGLAIISDEVFLDFSLDPRSKYLSLANNKTSLTFVLSGISKILGLPQMKLSWIIVNGPDELVRTACSKLEIIADTYLSVNTPVQQALPVWLNKKIEIQFQVLARIRENYQYLKDSIKFLNFISLIPSEGGWYAVLHLQGIEDEEEFILKLLQEDRVYVHPGYFFDFTQEGCLVLSLLTNPEVFKKGLRKIIARMTMIS